MKHGIGMAEARRTKLRLERMEPCRERRRVGMPKFDDEHRPRVAHDEVSVPSLLEVGLGALENLVIDELAGRGPVPHRNDRGPQRLVDCRAVRDQKRAGRW